MTVTRDYLLTKPSRPPKVKVLFDTIAIPFAVNVAGGLEVALDQVAARMGLRPRVVVGGVLGVAALVTLVTLPSLRQRRRRRAW